MAPKAKEPREIPITLRAQLAVCRSTLPPRLRHFVMVLALRANYRTGRGLTGQAALGRAMGLGTRQVGRLWSELDLAWERQESPVAARREARYHTSDAYVLEVREGSWLDDSRPESRADAGDASEKVDATPRAVDVTLDHSRCDTQGQSIGHGRPKTGSQCDTHVAISSQRVAIANSAVRRELQTLGPSAAGGSGPENGDESAPLRSSPLLLDAAAAAPHLTRSEASAYAAQLWPDEWAEQRGEDETDTARRRMRLRERARETYAALQRGR